MKTFIVMLVVILSGFFQSCSSKAENEKFVIKRGTNISHWLSQSSRRGMEREKYFAREDVEYLAGLGFDHLRIPIDEEQMWNEAGEMEREAFDLLNNALDWCAEFNLRAIVDLHILRSHHFIASERPLWRDRSEQEKFVKLWRDLSSQLQKRPVSMVAYELMNEPVADDPEDWNTLVAETVKEIRLLEPNRVLVIGSNRWQNVDTFDQLRIPENDSNIILSFHMYKPLVLTHYQASWNKVGEYAGPVNYPGQVVEEKYLQELPEDLQRAINYQNGNYNRETFIKLLQKPLQVSEKYNLPLYCGEWGCYYKAPQTASHNWYRDVKSVFEEFGVAWTTWDYKGGFGIIDREGKPNEELIRILLD